MRWAPLLSEQVARSSTEQDIEYGLPSCIPTLHGAVAGAATERAPQAVWRPQPSLTHQTCSATIVVVQRSCGDYQERESLTGKEM